MSDRLAYLDAVLRARLVLTEARHSFISGGRGIAESIVPTPRLVLFRSGRVVYC